MTLALLATASTAWPDSALGRWQTVSDETGKAEAIVELWLEDEELKGKIVQLLEPEEPDPICTLCEGDRKDQAVLGMIILWGMSANGQGWEGGKILDPNNGKVYRAQLRVNAEGQLEVRGFIGFALLGRTQVWQRVE